MAGTKITSTGVLYINGQQVENTFTNISKITKKLESELKKLPIGTKEFIDKANEVKIARARFEEVKKEINAVSDALDKSTGFLGFFKNGLLKVGDTMREVFTANLFERTLDAIISKGKLTVDQLLEIADAMTDVQKTSGMSLEQVKELWDQFDEMDTRTSKMDRLKIAEVGGRLGVPIEEMKSFVQEVDKAYVALGDSFEGGLEGVVDQLGKIKGLFETTKTMTYAEAINRVGSALNTLAAQGTASEGNISQFALRVGALPDSLKPAIDKVLGLGAAFEEAGIDAQIGSSGFSNFITTAAENIELFAYSMHMSIDEAKKLINTKPEEFFLRFAEGMKGVPADQTAKIFASLKLNSLEVQKAVGAAANKTDDFRKAMKTAGEEMDKMTSLQSEFNQKNNNAPAILEKIKNAWNDIFTSTNVINKFEWVIQLIGALTGVTKESSEGVNVFKERLVFLFNILQVVATAIVSYNVGVLISTISVGNLTKATWLSIIADKAKAAAMYVSQVAILAYNVSLGILYGSITRVRQAIAIFNAVTNSNGIGVLVSLITTAYVAWRIYGKELDGVARAQKQLNDLNKKANENAAQELSKLDLLYRKATDATKSVKERTIAVRELKEEYPSYFKNISDEIIMNGKAEKSYRSLRDSILSAARVDVLKDQIKNYTAKDLDIEIQLKETLEKFKKAKEVLSKTSNAPTMTKTGENWEFEKASKNVDDLRQKYADLLASRKDLRKEFQVYLDEIDKEEKKSPKKEDNEKQGITNIAAPEKPKKNREAETAQNDLEKAKEAYTKSLEAKAEADKKMLELQRAYEDEKNKILLESRQKAIDDEKVDFERKKQDKVLENVQLQNQIKKNEDEIAKLEWDKKNTKNSQAAQIYESAISELKKVNKKTQEEINVNNQIVERMEQTHRFNILKINEFWDSVDFEKFVKKEQMLIDESRRKDEEEIIAISSLAEAKSKIKAQTEVRLSREELKGIKTLEDAKAVLREAADRRMLNAQLISFNKQKALLLGFISQLTDGPAKTKLLEDLAKIEQAITSVRAAMSGNTNQNNAVEETEQTKAKQDTDILGFSAKNWEDTFSNIENFQDALKATAMAFQALGNAGQMYAQLQQALGERELRHFNAVQDKKKKSLLKQLNDGYITREEYTKQTEKLEAEAANKKAEIEYKQAKAEKIAKMFTIIGSTAAAIATALTAGPIAGPILAGIVGAIGAVQLAIVAAQPLPERPKFADGGFTGDGFGSADSTGFKPAGIVHENEWVAPAWMLEEPRTAKLIDYLESVRQGKTKPMADGGFSSDNTTSPVALKSTEPNANAEYYAVITEVRDFLRKLYDEGVIAMLGDDLKTIRQIAIKLKELQQLENKNKH
ncbi:phage tail tape measure protein [Epilithonimonas hominis]|uniref:phage tail tape measure protein n=1 Tax=Epilithonimonas hominis TaxID=420404 RepID=UPI002897D53D|nr:phage tail tape measure protein [Epilithonimonas hominis]